MRLRARRFGVPERPAGARVGWPRALRVWVATCVLALGSQGLASGATLVPYVLSIATTGNPAMDQAITDASQLARLRERAPVGPFALLNRAETDIVRIDRVLRAFGYYDALVAVRIDGLDTEDPALLSLLESRESGRPVTVAVDIETGPLYRIGTVRLEGNLPESGRAAFDLRPGTPAAARAVLDAGEAVRAALAEEGHALAVVSAPEAVVDHDRHTMDVTYWVEAGPSLTLGEITIIGLERLERAAVLRRLGLEPGEPYSPSRLESARRDLLAGGVLAWARLTPGDVPDALGRLPLTLEVAERPRRVVSGSAAWSSDEGGALAASWTHRNLLGGGERLDLRGEVGRIANSDLDSLSYLASLGLRFPDVWLRDLDLRLDLGAVSESLDAYDRDALTGGLALERRFSERISGSAGLALEASRIVQDGIAQDYRLFSLPLNLVYDGSDHPLDPRAGLRLAARLEPVGVASGDDGGFAVARVAASYYRALSPRSSAAQRPPGDPLLGRDPGGDQGGPDGLGPVPAPSGPWGASVLAGRLVLGRILGATADEVPPDWRFYAGGGGSVRGYPFQSIGPETAAGTPAGGTSLLEASVELRQRIGERWGGVVFVDAGSVSDQGALGSEGLAVGVGAGVRWFTPVGPVRFDLATPLDPSDGDSPVQLYIGIGQAF